MTTDKLVRRQQVLINLITRVGGRNNIQKWMDELLQIDVKLEKIEKENTMFKVNVQELHLSVQKKLTRLLDGDLKGGIITTPLNPQSFDWEELEIEIYGDIDPDADRLIECVSFVEVEEQDILKSDIQEGFNELNDWERYRTNGSFFSESLERVVSDFTFGLGRDYCGEVFTATGVSKQFATYSQMDGFGLGDSAEKEVFTKREYKHSDGTTVWSVENKPVISVLTEKEIVEKLQVLIYEHCKREKISWQEFLAKIEERKNLQEKLEKEAAEKAAKLEEAKSQVDTVWDQLLKDCPLATKKGLSTHAKSHKVTKPGDVSEGYIAKWGTKYYKDPKKFEADFLKKVYEMELEAQKQKALQGHGMMIDGYSVKRMDGGVFTVKDKFKKQYGKKPVNSILVENFHHCVESDGVKFPPTKPFEKWLQNI